MAAHDRAARQPAAEVINHLGPRPEVNLAELAKRELGFPG